MLNRTYLMKLQSNEMCNWYLLYTLPNYEKKVNLTLQRSKISTFLPLYKSERKWSDRKKIIEVPLFPNYIFIQTTPAERFKALDTFGVKCFVNCGGRPVLVRDTEISNIRKLIECTSLDIERKLSEGDHVRICEGPFKGMTGVVYEKKGQTRFGVYIESINQVLSIDVCSTWLKSVTHLNMDHSNSIHSGD